MQKTIYGSANPAIWYSREQIREIDAVLSTDLPDIRANLNIEWLRDEIIVPPFSGLVGRAFYVNDSPLHIPIRYEHRGKRLRILLVRDHTTQTIRVRAKAVGKRTQLVNTKQVQELLLDERRIPASIWAK